MIQEAVDCSVVERDFPLSLDCFDALYSCAAFKDETRCRF